MSTSDDQNIYVLLVSTRVASNSTNMRRLRAGKTGWELSENAGKGLGQTVRTITHFHLCSLYKERDD